MCIESPAPPPQQQDEELETSYKLNQRQSNSSNMGYGLGIWWIFLIALCLLPKGLQAIIAYDCTNPSVNISTINARSLKPCQEVNTTTRIKSQPIQLIELNNQYRVKVRQCKIVLTQTVKCKIIIKIGNAG
uniref:Uncharacterized protein n=1 Tax=Syphacia muris TaxID=451379 RepID=A0A0N5B0H5_9BILA